MAGDLRRAPPLPHQLADEAAQLGVGLHATPMMASPASDGTAVCLERVVVPAWAAVAAQLARDRRRRSSQLGCDGADASARAVKISDLEPLVLRQVAGADLAHGQTVQRWDEPDHLAVAVGLVTACPVAPDVRDTPTSRAAARTLHPRARNSMNRCRLPD